MRVAGKSKAVARLLVTLTACLLPLSVLGQANPAAPVQPRDGAHDFDWEIGNWTTHLRYLPAPLTGSTRWVEYRGTSDVRAAMGGRANLVELSVEGAAGKIEGVSLRLYNPKARQWTLNFADGGATWETNWIAVDHRR